MSHTSIIKASPSLGMSLHILLSISTLSTCVLSISLLLVFLHLSFLYFLSPLVARQKKKKKQYFICLSAAYIANNCRETKKRYIAESEVLNPLSVQKYLC